MSTEVTDAKDIDELIPPVPIREPESVPIPKARAPFELWATIKKASKYYRQGLDERGKPRPFKINAVIMVAGDSYDFKGGPGGAYRREDLQLWIKAEGGLKKI